jgi:hypothetical protein
MSLNLFSHCLSYFGIQNAAKIRTCSMSPLELTYFESRKFKRSRVGGKNNLHFVLLGCDIRGPAFRSVILSTTSG